MHVALDDLMRDRKVLHVSLDFARRPRKELVRRGVSGSGQNSRSCRPRGDARADQQNRIIQAYSLHGHGGANEFSIAKLKHSIELLSQHAQFVPDVIMIDAFDWSRATLEEAAELRALAKQFNVELWMTALTHRHQTGPEVPDRVPPPCDRFASLISLVVFLQPVDKNLSVRLLKDHDNEVVCDTHLVLHPTRCGSLTTARRARQPVICRRRPIRAAVGWGDWGGIGVRCLRRALRPEGRKTTHSRDTQWRGRAVCGCSRMKNCAMVM